MGIHNCYNGTRELSDHEKFVERRDAAAYVVRQERKRAAQIFAHPNVKNGTAIQLANFLVTQTDLSADEACATLDNAHAGEPEKVHHAGGLYEMGAQAAEHLLHPIEADRRAKQAINDQAFMDANFGSTSVDRRSDREKQQAEDFLRIARRANDDDEPEDDDDNNKLKAMGFGGGGQFEQSAYAAGAATAARLLGKPSATTAPRGADTGYARERQSPAIPAAPPGDAYAQGAESAKRLLFGTSAIRAELNHELYRRFAEQQRARAQR
jgi:hypothetical protein